MAAETPNTETPVTFQAADGKSYEMPDIFDLSIDEWEIDYDASGISIEDMAPLGRPGLEKERLHRLRNPALMRSLTQIGIMRATGQDAETCKALAGSVKMMLLLQSIGGDEEEENPTPASEPEKSSSKREGRSNGSSSPASSASSDAPGEELATTGTSG